jgi:hypothetical protein
VYLAQALQILFETLRFLLSISESAPYRFSLP